MGFSSKLSTLAGALVFAGSIFAAQQNVCPPIDAIKSEGIAMAEELFANYYIAFNLSQYTTNSIWVFLMAPIQAESDEVAISTGNDVLNTMSAPGTPELDEEGVLVCQYETGRDNLYGLAVKAENLISPMKLRKFIKIKH